MHELYKALEAGVDDFLAKPVVYCELLARLRAGARELELERRLGEHSGIDPLTGLPNRRALESRLGRQLSAGTGKSSLGVCVLMEVDFFQRVDHQFGRHAGETVLRDVAARLLELTGKRRFWPPSAAAGSPSCRAKSADRGSGGVGRVLAAATGPKRRSASASVACNSPRVLAWPAPAPTAPITAGEVLRRSAEALDLAKASGGDCVLRYGQFDDQDEAWSTFAAPGRLFEGAVARDVMTPLPGVLRTEELASEAVLLLRRCRLAALPAVDEDGKLSGHRQPRTASREDLSARATAGLTVGQVMKREVACLDEKASFAELVESFAQDAATPIVITHDGRPTGLAMPENLVVLGRKLTKENLARDGSLFAAERLPGGSRSLSGGTAGEAKKNDLRVSIRCTSPASRASLSSRQFGILVTFKIPLRNRGKVPFHDPVQVFGPHLQRQVVVAAIVLNLCQQVAGMTTPHWPIGKGDSAFREDSRSRPSRTGSRGCGRRTGRGGGTPPRQDRRSRSCRESAAERPRRPGSTAPGSWRR